VFTPVRRLGAFFALLALVLVCASCKADVRVDVTVRQDGTGTVTARVTLDREAVQRLTTSAPLAQAVPLDDLRAAGWQVSAWRVDARGAVITFSHPFVGQADLVRRLADLAGPNGVLRDARITHKRGWFRSSDAVSVNVDLRTPSAGVTTDAQLAGRLRAAGVDVSALDRQLQAELKTALTVQLAVHAPEGHTRTVTVQPGGQARASATDTRFELDRAITLGIGAALAFLALLFLAAAAVGKRRERRRRRARGPSRTRNERVPLM
jgi:hypothetical protein